MLDKFQKDWLELKEDYPQEGVSFYDISSVLSSPERFSFSVLNMCDAVWEFQPDVIAAVDSRGFLFAAPIAYEMGIKLILVRKNGKLPEPTSSLSYELEYGEDEICVKKDPSLQGKSVVIVDDIIATGGTINAAYDLLSKEGCNVLGFVALADIGSLKKENYLRKKATVLITL